MGLSLAVGTSETRHMTHKEFRLRASLNNYGERLHAASIARGEIPRHIFWQYVDSPIFTPTARGGTMEPVRRICVGAVRAMEEG